MGSSGQEEAPGIFRAWVEGASGNMALALAALVEHLQSWAKGVGLGGLTLLPNMDTLGTLLVGWMVFVTLILMLGTFFYFKFIHTLGNESVAEQYDTGPGDEGKGRGSKGKGGTGTAGSATPGKSKTVKREEARKPTIVPDHKPDPVLSPVSTGADPDAVKWTNNVFTWLYNSADGGQVIKKVWLETLNENTVKTAIETGILVEVVDLMKQTPAPVLSNMVVDCSPTDNVTITCDLDATLYLRIITTRTQGDQTTESEYACAVTPLHGRLNIAAVTAELLAVAKFDGWPEVSLKLEGIRNNATGLDEQQMLDVIDEVLTSALRNSVLEFNFQSNMTFPRFRRARQVPDPIIPVGYDSMVREKQTHPPSVPRKTPKTEFVPLHDEKIEAAGESFTALAFSSNLTSSEEQLIARNLTKYPSLENAEMGPEEIEEFCKTWQENYVPATDVPPSTESAPAEVLEPPPHTSPATTVGTLHEEESEPKTQNFVLMVSNRAKLIDEPRNTLLDDEEMNGIEEEEEAELANIMPPHRPADEPCLRKETGSPLLLAAPKVSNLAEPEDDDLEDAKLRFDRLEILDKPQVGSTAGLGPLHKGPFVSEACCVGVQVGVAAQVPQLDLRIETAALGGSVACDLPEYDQETPTQPSLLPLLHNQPSSATTLCLEPGVGVDYLLSGAEEVLPSPSPFHSLSSEPFIPTASGVCESVDESSDENDVEEREFLVSVGDGDSSPSHQSSGVVVCAELATDSLPDRDDSEETVSEEDEKDSRDFTMLDHDLEDSLEKEELDVNGLPERKDFEESALENENGKVRQDQELDYPSEDKGITSLNVSEIEFEYYEIENDNAQKDNSSHEFNVDSGIFLEKQFHESDILEDSIEISVVTDEDKEDSEEANTIGKEEDDEVCLMAKYDDEEEDMNTTANNEDNASKELSNLTEENGNVHVAIGISPEEAGYDDEVYIMANEDEDKSKRTGMSGEGEGDELNIQSEKEATDDDTTRETITANGETESHKREAFILNRLKDESKEKKMCLNEFTENLFKHIEVEDSELSIPEECVENQLWEVMDAYEPQDSSHSSSSKEGSSEGDSNLKGTELLPLTPQGPKTPSLQEPEPPLTKEQESSLSFEEHESQSPSLPQGLQSSEVHESPLTTQEQDLLSVQEQNSPQLSPSRKTLDGEDSEKHHEGSESVTGYEEPLQEEHCNGSDLAGDELESKQYDITDLTSQDCEAENVVCVEKNDNLALEFCHEELGKDISEKTQENYSLYKPEKEEDIQNIYSKGREREDLEEDLVERHNAARRAGGDNNFLVPDHSESSSVILDVNGNGVNVEMEAEDNGVATTGMDLEREESDSRDNLTIEPDDHGDCLTAITNDEYSNAASTITDPNEGSSAISSQKEIDSNVISSETESCSKIVNNKTGVLNKKISIEFDRDTHIVSIDFGIDNSNVKSTEVEVPDKCSNGSNIKTEPSENGSSLKIELYKDSKIGSTKVEVPDKDNSECRSSEEVTENAVTPNMYKDIQKVSKIREFHSKDSNGTNTGIEVNVVQSKADTDENTSKHMEVQFDKGSEFNIETQPNKDGSIIADGTETLIQATNGVSIEEIQHSSPTADTDPLLEQEKYEDEVDYSQFTEPSQQHHLGAFIPSDSEVEMRTSISSLESLTTQLQEALKNKYYASLRYPSSFSGEDSTTDANTDDEYVDPCIYVRDPFSPEEEDFTLSGEEIGYSSHGTYSAQDSSTDSEVEGIIGTSPDAGRLGLQSKEEWRKSDISLIAEAEATEDTDCASRESQVTPTPLQDSSAESSHETMKYRTSDRTPDDVFSAVQYRVVNARQGGGQQDNHQLPRLVDEEVSHRHIIKNSSPDKRQEKRVSIAEDVKVDSKGTQFQDWSSSSVGHRYSGREEKLSDVSGGGGGRNLLTTAPQSVAPLTPTDNTGALTQPQVASHAGKWSSGGAAAPGHTPFASGLPQWTKPLPSYPIYGTYFVTSTPHTTATQPMGIPGLNGKRLLVKIVKAAGVGCEKPVSEAYSVVEMDEPPQKFTTSVVKDTNSPFWDEQFLFDLSGGTLELLFELYDKTNGNFLGLGIVGIEELVATPSQRQIIPLQSRPYENDEVSGSLTVEFLFLDRADLPEHTLRASTTSQSVTPRGDLVTTTTTTYIKAPENQDIVVNGGDSVATAVLRDIEEKKSVVTNNASKSTMIIHASKKPDLDGQHGYTTDDLLNLTMTATSTTATPTITTTGAHTTVTTATSTTTTTHSAPATTTADTSEPAENEERGRSRGVRRKRDSFFGTLKKRFSRSKVRSKSMDPGVRDSSLERDPSVGRSVSMERSSALNRASDEAQPGTPSTQDSAEPRLLSVPLSAGGDAGSTRSSLSDASAISGSSTRTYVNEASTLIIETSENGVFKHYLIPLSLQQKSKWRKKGLKLHIFGEHTFVAKHMASSTQCEVCQKTLGRRFGKQGYVCRDCGYKCHKPCHVKTETTCPKSTVNNMDLEYVRDPREERRAWLKKTNKTA